MNLLRKKLLSYRFLFSTLLLGAALLLFSVFQNQSRPVAADAPFVEVFRGNGFFFVAAGGDGTRGDPETGFWSGEGSFVLDIPDSATITMARLIWTGRALDYDPDGVELYRNGTFLAQLDADIQYEQVDWCCNGADQRHESAIVTDLVIPGEHTYTVTDHEHGVTPTGDYLNYGVGMWVVYEYDDPNITNDPERETVVYQGQDSFFRLWDPPFGPHTEVRCADYAPSATKREAEVTHLVSGIDTWDTVNDETYRRSVIFWHESGNGPQPPPQETDPPTSRIPSLSLRPDAVGIAGENPGEYPIQSFAGLEWDTFEVDPRIEINAGDEWTCFQIESGDSENLAGIGGADRAASGMWNLFAISIFDPSLAVDLLSFEGTAVSATSVLLEWETGAEINNFGFNLYRSETGDFADAELIHFEPSDSGNSGGAAYAYLDTVTATGTFTYWLEDIDTDSGIKTVHGPVQVQVSPFSFYYLPTVLHQP